ncbi:MAG TPA: hypothetical protein VLB45_00070 [Nitrosopumilaceae archaeon]|nr:hypothetical protein [Nitrosopumilaceae archaeon]
MNNLALKLVFSNRRYLILSTAIFLGMILSLSIISEFLFLEPYVIFYIPDYRIVSFLLLVIVSALSGLVISMSVYRILLLHTTRISSGFVGSIIGASAGACSCGSVGFAIASTFGAVGGAATAFLTNYEIPLRVISIGILVYSYYISAKGLSAQCKVQK